MRVYQLGVDAPAGRALAMLALFGVVLALMIAPALIAGASLLGSHVLGRPPSWFHWMGAMSLYLDLGRLGSTLVLTAIVSSAREDE